MYWTVLEMEAGHSCVFSVFACVVLKDAIGFGTDNQWTDLLLSSRGSGASFAAFATVVLSFGFTQFTGLLDVKRDTKDSITYWYYRAFPFCKKQTKYNSDNSVIQKYGHNGSKGFLTLSTPRASGFTAPPSPLS